MKRIPTTTIVVLDSSQEGNARNLHDHVSAQKLTVVFRIIASLCFFSHSS